MQSKYKDESVATNNTFEESSESEAEDDASSDNLMFNTKYMREIANFLGTHNAVNCENALLLNKEMQTRLQDVKKRLQSLLQDVQGRYIANEKRVKQNLCRKQRGVGMRGAYLKGGTFYFKGNMFFKDLNCRNCPNNHDYEYRKNVEGEMFPMDFELCSRHVWSLMDKTAVVQAVKEQVIDYLADRRTRDKTNKTKTITRQISVHTEKLASLFPQVDEKFEVDWEQVSAHNLNFRHSPSSCKTMWQVYLHPSLKRSAWTAEENQRLLEAAQRYKYRDWGAIASVVSKRSDYQCFIQYQTTVCYMDTQRWGRWDKRDDIKLLDLIEKNTVNGVIDWNTVASYFPRKNKNSLHQRYSYYLDPKISHEPFSAEEDLILLAAVEEYGEKFALLPRTLFPNRSITQLRIRYKNTLKHRHKLTPWSVEDDKKLMEFVAEHGASAWLCCAEKLGNHNRISCRTRFLTIQKFFSKNPNAVLEDIPRKNVCSIKHSVITTQNWVEKVAELRKNPETVLVPPKRKRGKLKASEDNPTKQQKTVPEKAKTKRERISATVAKDKSPFLHELPNDSNPITAGVSNAITITKRTIRRPAYVERLRAVEQKLYHFFKYSYNFRLGSDVCTQPPTSSLHMVATALDFQPHSTRPFVTDPLLPPYVRRRCKSYLLQERKSVLSTFKKPFGYRLPPNWSTAMAFRALCVHSAQVQLNDSDENKPVDVGKIDAVQRFRIRMHALLYKTALLSRLQPTLFTELMGSTIFSATRKEVRERILTDADECTEPALDLHHVKDEFQFQAAVNSGQITALATEIQPDADFLTVQKKLRKSNSRARLPTERQTGEEPARKRVCRDAKCDEADEKCTSIKTEFETQYAIYVDNSADSIPSNTLKGSQNTT